MVTWLKCDFWNYELPLSEHKFALKLVVTFTTHLSVTTKRLTRYKQRVVFAAMLEGKSMPSAPFGLILVNYLLP